MSNLVPFILGALAGGGACAWSAKVLGWFNKQVASVKKDV